MPESVERVFKGGFSVHLHVSEEELVFSGLSLKVGKGRLVLFFETTKARNLSLKFSSFSALVSVPHTEGRNACAGRASVGMADGGVPI